MLEQLRSAWQNLQPRQRLILSAVAGTTLVALIAVGYWSSRPSYGVLYSNLSPEDAGAVVEELRKARVPYRLGASGASILVPSGQLYETRFALATKGMPSRGSVGFELFDKSSLPGTDFSNEVNLQRAMQGELARTIASLSEVRSARVHLSMGRESLYEEPTPPTASVLLDIGPNGALRPEQVRGIAYLVASAVHNLNPQNVTIVDTQGRILQGRGATGDLWDTTLATSKAYSEALTARLQSMLDVIFGAGMTIVRAQAELNMDNEETSEERVEPVSARQTSTVAKEHTAEESYRGSASSVGGLGGVPSNLRGGAAASGVEGPGEYESKEVTREYDVSRKRVTRKRVPGRLTRLTVAAVVDESLAAQGIDRVRELLEAAAGVDPARGDSIVVRPMKLKSAELAAEEAKRAQAAQLAQQRQQTLSLILQRGLPLVVAVVLLAVFVRTASEFRRGARTPAAEPVAPDVMAEYQRQLAQQVPLQDAAPEAPAPVSQEEQEERAVVEELRRIARDQPDILAEELRNLVSSQEGI